MNYRKNKTVFLIDDDNLTNVANRGILLKSGYDINVHTFISPGIALNALKQLLVLDWNALPDVILLNVNMPEMDGWHFLAEYERLMADFDCKIYMLGASISAEDILRSEQCDIVTGLLPKPLKAEQLYNIVESMVMAA